MTRFFASFLRYQSENAVLDPNAYFCSFPTISLCSFHAAFPCYCTHPALFQTNFLGWDAMHQIDWVNRHLPCIHKRIKSKHYTATSHVSWSIGFEMSLADSLVHHFLDYVNFCTRCERFMQIFAPTQTFKTFSKTFQITTKNQMPPNPRN